MKRVYINLAFLLMLPTALLAMPQNIVEVRTQEFYYGITVTSMKMANGDFTALVSDPSAVPGNNLNKTAHQSNIRARYDLRAQAKMGSWRVFPFGPGESIEQEFDYRASTSDVFLDQLDSIIASHSVESVALSALWLYEEYLFEADLAQKKIQAALRLPGFEKELREVCDACTANTNGCSPGWVVPDSCGGFSIFSSCENHDSCYQCGAACSGTSRLECDQNFRSDILNAGASIWCADIYYLGVRGLGWLFYQDPSARPYMGPDVYTLGIQLSACEGQYVHMCTTFLM